MWLEQIRFERVPGRLLLGVVFLFFSAGGQAAELEKDYINPTPSYTHAIAVTGNGVKTIYVSGQVAISENGIPGTFAEQADMALTNLVAQLADAGATPADVIKLNTFIVDIDREKVALFSEARNKHLHMSPPPASTVVGISGLVREAFMIEIEAIAVVSADE